LATGFLTYILLVVEKLGSWPLAVVNLKVGVMGQIMLWLALGLIYGSLRQLVLKKNEKNVKISCSNKINC
jgi:hypothetical protein